MWIWQSFLGFHTQEGMTETWGYYWDFAVSLLHCLMNSDRQLKFSKMMYFCYRYNNKYKNTKTE